MLGQALMPQHNNQKSEIKFRNVAGPKASPPMKIKSAASILYQNSSKTPLPYTLYISVSTRDQSIQSLIFSYGQETKVKQLTQFIKQRLTLSNAYFKSSNILIDHFLTLGDRQVIQLNTNKIYLTVHYVQVCEKISLKCVQILKCIGSGGFSKVLLARVYGIMMAIKIIDKQFVFRTAKQSIVQNQKLILQICEGHPFITKLFFAFQTNKFIVLGMQYCNGGQLFNLLRRVKKMRQNDAKFYFIETLMAIQHLHSKGILYRDLKPQNIIIDADGHVRLADFGLSKIINRSLTYSFCGSAQYMSPEMLLKKGHSYQVDYYCLGALLYQLVTGLPPFYSQNQSELFNGILNNELTFPSHAVISDQLKFFLYKILQKQPEKRFQNISQILNDPWVLYDFNRQQVLNKKLVPPYPTTSLSYNFDDSQFQFQETTILKLIKNEGQSFEDPKLRSFKDFYYQSEQIIKLKKQVDQNNFKNFMKNKMKEKKSQIYGPSSRNNSVYSQKQSLGHRQKKVSMRYEDSSGTTSSMVSAQNSITHAKSAQNLKNIISIYSSQKRANTKNLNIYTNKPKFPVSNKLKNNRINNMVYGNQPEKSFQMKLNSSLSREHGSIDWLKQKSSSLDRGYVYKPQLSAYNKNYMAEYRQKYATPKVKKSFRTGDRINFHYGSINR